MSSREAFELWVRTFHTGSPITTHIDNDENSETFGLPLYDEWHVQVAWAGWEASRASLAKDFLPF